MNTQRVKLTEFEVINALARYFSHSGRLVFANAKTFYWEMDFSMLTKAGFLSEVEIKLIRSDWLLDVKKSKWATEERKYIDRFYYAVPKKLVTNIPDFVSAETGIFVIGGKAGGCWVSLFREAKKQNRRLPDDLKNKLLISSHYKYWNMRHKT